MYIFDENNRLITAGDLISRIDRRSGHDRSERLVESFFNSPLYDKLSCNPIYAEYFTLLKDNNYRFWYKLDSYAFFNYIFEKAELTTREYDYLDCCFSNSIYSLTAKYLAAKIKNINEGCGNFYINWSESAYRFLLVRTLFFFGYGIHGTVLPSFMRWESIEKMLISATDSIERHEYLMSVSTLFTREGVKPDMVNILRLVDSTSKHLPINSCGVKQGIQVIADIWCNGLTEKLREELIAGMNENKVNSKQFDSILRPLVESDLDNTILFNLAIIMFGADLQYTVAAMMNSRWNNKVFPIEEVSSDILKEVKEKIAGELNGNENRWTQRDYTIALYAGIALKDLELVNQILGSDNYRSCGIVYKKMFRLSYVDNKSLFSSHNIRNRGKDIFSYLLFNCELSSDRPNIILSKKSIESSLFKHLIIHEQKNAECKSTISWLGKKYKTDINELFCNYVLLNTNIIQHEYVYAFTPADITYFINEELDGSEQKINTTA
jgi:hypothetical protein